MRGTSAVSVSNPPPRPLRGPSQAHPSSFFETRPLYVLKKSHSGARVMHTIRSQVPLCHWPLTWHDPCLYCGLPGLSYPGLELPWPDLVPSQLALAVSC